jgi:hypothetical protein
MPANMRLVSLFCEVIFYFLLHIYVIYCVYKFFLHFFGYSTEYPCINTGPALYPIDYLFNG